MVDKHLHNLAMDIAAQAHQYRRFGRIKDAHTLYRAAHVLEKDFVASLSDSRVVEILKESVESLWQMAWETAFPPAPTDQPAESEAAE